MLTVQKFNVGPLDTNCYLITDENTLKSAIIDPGGISGELDAQINVIGKENVEYILMTHGHFDHIRKALRYQKLTSAKLVIGSAEAGFIKDSSLNLCRIPMEPFDVDILLIDGDIISLGETKIKVIHTPGHTVGGVCFVTDDCLFTGDTLMKKTIGRCDLKTGNFEQMKKSLSKIADLTKNYKIYPGHGDFSTLIAEKENNLYLKRR